MELKMQLDGKILEKIKIAGPKARQIFTDSVRDASTVLMEASIREAPASTGNLRKGIRREITGSGLRASIYPSVQYAERLHGDFESSQSHSEPFMIPAQEAQEGGTLYRWAKKKGMNPWAVRAVIAKRGVKHNPFLRRASEKSESGVRTIFEKSIHAVAQFLGD